MLNNSQGFSDQIVIEVVKEPGHVCSTVDMQMSTSASGTPPKKGAGICLILFKLFRSYGSHWSRTIIQGPPVNTGHLPKLVLILSLKLHGISHPAISINLEKELRNT